MRCCFGKFVFAVWIALWLPTSPSLANPASHNNAIKTFQLAANIPSEVGPDKSLMGEDRIPPADVDEDGPGIEEDVPVILEEEPLPDVGAEPIDDINELPPSAEDAYLPVERPQPKAKTNKKTRKKLRRNVKKKAAKRKSRAQSRAKTYKERKASKVGAYRENRRAGNTRRNGIAAYRTRQSYSQRRLYEYRNYSIMPFGY